MRQERTISAMVGGVVLLAVSGCESGDPTGPGGNNGASGLALDAGSVTSFGQDSAAELYMVSAEGAVLKIVALQ